MKTIIAGSRDAGPDRAYIGIGFCWGMMVKAGMQVTEIVSGGARGPDSFGESIGADYGVPVKLMKADWDNLTAPGAVVKVHNGKRYNAKAGTDRNSAMAAYADALIAIWDGKSSGTRDMIEKMKKLGKPVFVHRLDKGPMIVEVG